MGPDPNSEHDPFSLQESRRERGARRSRSHRDAIVGAAITVIVLGAIGAGVYFFLFAGGPPVVSTTTVSTAEFSSSTTVEATSSTTSLPPTSTTLANPGPESLQVATNPAAATLTITLQDGTSLTGKTPFSEEVPGGRITVEIAKPGYNIATRELTLDAPRDLHVWLDPAGQLLESLVRFKTGAGPQQLAFSPDGRELWAALLRGEGLEVYGAATGLKTGEVSLGGKGAADLVFTGDGETIYAAQPSTNSIYEVDRVSRTVKRQFKVGGKSPKLLALSADDKTLWAANWDSADISEIDLATGTETRRMATVAKPRGLYATADGTRLYVAGAGDGAVQRIDLTTGAGTVVLKTGGAMWDLVADENRDLLYADDNEGNAVYVIDLTTDTATKLAATDQRPNNMDLSADGMVLYVANRGKENPENATHAGPEWGSVLAIDTVAGTVLDAIVGGNQTTGLDVSADGSLLAFSDYLDDHVSVYTIPAYSTLVAGNGGRAAQHLKDIVKP